MGMGKRPPRGHSLGSYSGPPPKMFRGARGGSPRGVYAFCCEPSTPQVPSERRHEP